MAKKTFSKPGCQKYPGGNLAPPWSCSNPYGLLVGLGCLLPEYDGSARLSHTCSQRLNRHGLEVGQKNGKKNFFETGLPEVSGGVTWRHRGIFPIRLDRCKA